MSHMELYTSFLSALIVALNPIGNVPFFLAVTAGHTKEEKARIANLVFITVSIIITITVFLGQKILHALDIDIGAFRIGSGVVLFLLGLEMVQKGIAPPEELMPEKKKELTLVPLAIPLVAGPAMFATLISKTENVSGFFNEIIFSLLGVVGAFTIWLAHKFAASIERFVGIKGLDVATRLVGLILMSIAVQTMSAGVKDLFFPLK